MLAVMALGVVTLSAGVAAQPADDPPVQTLGFDFDSFTYEASRGHFHFRNPRSTQGELSLRADNAFAEDLANDTEWRLQGNVRIGVPEGAIEADEALGEGLEDFGRNEWLFAGDVRITAYAARLQAEDARFAFENNQLVRGELTGAPAAFEHQAANRVQPARGTADRIHYDTTAQTLRLSGNVTVRVPVRGGHVEYSGCDLVYDLARQDVTAGSSEDCGEPLHFRIPVQTGNADPPPTP